MSNGRKRTTQSDVARLAGVSPAVVSAVIRGKGSHNIRVGDDTRLRVLEAMKQLNYVPDVVAQTLAGGKRRIIGLFSFEPVFPKEQNDFFRPFLLGVEKAAEANGYDLMLFTSVPVSGGRKRIYQQGINRLGLADGVILLGRNPPIDDLVRLEDEGFPFVYIGRKDAPDRTLSYVAADYRRATLEVIEHLHQLGHRRIAYLGEPQPIERHRDREAGYSNALQQGLVEANAEFRLRLAASDITDDVVSELLERSISAVVVEDIEQAEALYAQLANRGIAVPTDFSIGLLGEPDAPSQLNLDWSGFTIPREEMGYQAFISLLARLERKIAHSATQITLPCSFRTGATVGPERVTATPTYQSGV
ncbi:MAG: LacI family DNA-binding transcriptional regulator [Saccharospirillum sp.]|uniref:LacI family DNA-binding transcriptional regulator n=1 Tax=Saccharospirillum sp. TaxID=2033801 RepID=UPI0032975961